MNNREKLNILEIKIIRKASIQNNKNTSTTKTKKHACRFVFGRPIATNNKNKKTKRRKY